MLSRGVKGLRGKLEARAFFQPIRKMQFPYRLSPTKDKMWHLYGVQLVSDSEGGALIGKYRTRGDVTKVVSEVAFRAEPR
jgi:hypothetical protein